MRILRRNSIIFTKEKTESLSKIRILKTNLIHVHGFPKRIARNKILKSPEYFGQYGTIERCIISYKINPDNDRKTYSAYITFSNEREAAIAILCVDSLMIQGKIVRAFFGTSKYCKYFLSNSICPIKEKCMFLHQIATCRDIIIDSDTAFSYDDHLNLAKKIIQFSKPEIINSIRLLKKPEKNVFPFLDFIFMNEEEKENYFNDGIISYFRSNEKERENILLNNNFERKSTNSLNINLKDINI